MAAISQKNHQYLKNQNDKSKYLWEVKYLGIFLEYPGVGDEDVDTHINTDVFYSDANKQWHVKYYHDNHVEGYDHNHFASESGDMVDI